jgi:hypothetical protein
MCVTNISSYDFINLSSLFLPCEVKNSIGEVKAPQRSVILYICVVQNLKEAKDSIFAEKNLHQRDSGCGDRKIQNTYARIQIHKYLLYYVCCCS